LKTAPAPGAAPFHLKIHDDILRLMTKLGRAGSEGDRE
jgi:hypothetical protein